MTSSTAPTWWEEHQAASSTAEEPSTAPDPPFSDALLALLAEVERAFAVTGADTPGWEDPHLGPDGIRREAGEEEYSRCLDPGKHRILDARAEAWALVLAARGWAVREEIADGASLRWRDDPHSALHRTTVLRPLRSGAQPVLLARTAPDGEDGHHDLEPVEALLPGLVVGVGDPPLVLASLPDCGCDACDSGSGDLLEQLDQVILSIVDGSCEVEVSPHGRRARTSFGSESGSGVDQPDMTARIAAGPWAEEWVPRPMGPMLEPEDSAWAEEMLREPWPSRLLDALIRALPTPVAVRLDRLRPGRSGTLSSRVYSTPAVARPVTVPLDALEHPPAGYRRMHRSAVLPGADFDRARAALRGWDVHRRAGLGVAATDTPLREGTEVRLVLGAGPLRITAPCRVLEVIDEPDRAGFAYGTLPGHPESGIEAFTLTRTATGLVRVHIDAVSRPAIWYARLGAPLSRLAQELVTRRYLRALDPRSAR